MPDLPSLADVRAAAERIKPLAHVTPVLTSRLLNDLTGADLFFKCENFQRAGAFKFRGASNAVFSLTDQDAAQGVVTVSSGNHAGALALAASLRGIPCHVVMPEKAPEVKKAAVKGYGATIHFIKQRNEFQAVLDSVIDQTGATFIPPYDHPAIVAGQGTAGLELLDQAGDLDIVMAPVGGGGLLSGVATAVKGAAPETAVWAAEPAGADDAVQSMAAGRIIPQNSPDTICDGLLTSLGELTFAVIRDKVDRIITVGDETVVRAMRLLMERMKIVVEPSGAICLGAILENKNLFAGKKVGLILSGGNVDLGNLPWNG